MEKTDSIYVIEDLVSAKRTTTHFHNLRPFNFDPAYTSPLVVAQHYEQEFIVESISTHHGSRNRRSTLEFQVRWAGFGETCDSCGQAPRQPPGKHNEDSHPKRAQEHK